MPEKTVLVTGSTDSRSLGWTVAKLLATGSFGFTHIIVSGRNEDKCESAAEELRNVLPLSSSVKISGSCLDVTSDESIFRFANTLSSLDVLINNAGVGSPPGRLAAGEVFLPTQDTTAEDIMIVMQTNVAAVVELTNQLVPLLAKSPNPRVFNVSSARGSLSFAENLPAERTGALLYNTSKAALNMATVMQSKNLPLATNRSNLKVNAASPGHVKTPLNNFSGTRTLEEGANAIVYLATLPDNGPTGKLIGNHAPFSSEGDYVEIPW